MDNPGTESTGTLDASQAGSLIANLLSPEPVKDDKAELADADKALPASDEPAGDPPPPPADEGANPPEPAKVTILVDGKTVELTSEQIADAYKNGMRQEDYTRKTMEAAEKRKTADAETTKAREERQQYAQGLEQAQVLLQASLQEQSQIDWQKLLDTDPVEYLKQQHLAQDRQAKLQRVLAERNHLATRDQAEAAEQTRIHHQEQHEQLLAKFPEWKDGAKAKADWTALNQYLDSVGYPAGALSKADNHLAVVLAHKAMKYDEMISKASAAAKKVANLPQKVERPGNGELNHLDKRGEQYKKLAKTGSVRDAASLMSNFF